LRRFCLFLLFSFFLSASAQTRLRSALIVDQANLGDVEISFHHPQQDLKISRADLNAFLAPILLESKWERLLQANSGLDMIPARELERIGIKVQFDEKTLELRCLIPLEIRRLQELSLDPRNKGFGLDLGSTPGSGYLNLTGLQGYTTSEREGFARPDPFEGQVELVQNLGPVTLESLGLYKDRESNPWERGDTALVSDLPSWQTRIRLGDSSPLTSDYMSSLPAGGLHVYRQFGIDPARPSIGLRSAVIQVEKPSWLEISVNRVLIAKMRVPVGPLNLKDLPLLVGRNRIHIKLTDDFEKSEEFDVDLFFDNALLGQGVHDFSYFVGRPWLNDSREREYQKDGFVSLLHRYGLNDRVTLGLDAQTYQDQRVVGGEIGFLTPFGSVQSNLASSRNQMKEGTADHWRFRSSEQDNGFLKSNRLLVDYEHRSTFFVLPALLPSSLPEFSTKAEANFQTLIGSGKSFSYGGGYQWGQNGFQDSRFYRAGIQSSLAYGFRMDLSFVETIRSSTDEQWLFNLTWSEPTGVVSANVLTDSLNHQTLLGAHKSARRQSDDISADASWQNSEDSNQLSLRTNYLGRRADLLFQQDSSTVQSRSTNQTRVGLGTAIAWAGGKISLSRPIRDSFAFLSAQDMPEQGKLRINPSGDTEAESVLESNDSYILANLSSYQKTNLQIDSTTLPIGYSLDREFYRLRPQYRSGVYVDLGLSRKVYTRGRLIRANGQPLSFQDGQIYNEKNQLVSDTFFTGDDGQFILDQLKPGTYQIQLHEAGWKRFSIHLPENEMELNLAPLTVQRQEGM
jgi:outer membrane usher protein